MQQLESTHTIKLLSDYWVMTILAELEKSSLRFCELQRAATGINPVTLTDRLKKLEQAKLIERTERDRQTVTYELGDRGREVLPFIRAFQQVATHL